MSVHLNLLDYKDKIKIKKINEVQKIYDPVRRNWFILQPEEFVRQLIILYLHEALGYPLKLISVERQLIVNNLRKRFDIAVYNGSAQPCILIECKAPTEQINMNTAMQIANYNRMLQTEYLWISNGTDNYMHRINFEKEVSTAIDSLPSYKIIK